MSINDIMQRDLADAAAEAAEEARNAKPKKYGEREVYMAVLDDFFKGIGLGIIVAAAIYAIGKYLI